jgi:hypothetical protein
MDADRFDAVTKALSNESSRRRAMRLLAGALSSSFPDFRWESLAAECGRAGSPCCKAKGKGKGKGKGKAKKKGKAKGTCNANAECNSVGYCRCKTGFRDCAGECIAPDDCCVGGTRVKNGGTYGQCGQCYSGVVVPNFTYCDLHGCQDCGLDFLCKPYNEGYQCAGACGRCKGGECDPSGQTVCSGAPFNCCPAAQDCCHVLANGRNECRGPDDDCGKCGFYCGGNECCNWATHVNCCLNTNGTFRCC